MDQTNKLDQNDQNDQNNQSDQNNNEKKKDYKLRPKVFKVQESYLCRSLLNREMKSAYHIILAFIVYFCFANIIYYLTNPEELNNELKFLKDGLNHYEIFLMMEIGFNLMLFGIIYPSTKYWIQLRSKEKINQNKIDLAFALFVIGIVGLHNLLILKLIVDLDIGPIMSVALISEKIRLSMKTQAFVIESKRKQEAALEKDNKDAKFMTYKQLLYYMFAPTFICRDEYPRLEKRDYKLLTKLLLQFFIALYTLMVIVYRVLLPFFRNIGLKPIDGKSFVKDISIIFVCASVICFLVFYGFLHLYQNICSQIFRFGDRVFYDEWWYCTDYTTFYRKWNILVHDWIHAYLYSPLVHLFRGNKIAAGVVSIYISAIGHEYLIAVSLRHLNPILSILFAGVGVILFVINGLMSYSYRKKMKKLSADKKIDLNKKKEILISDEKYIVSNILFLLGVFNGWFLMILMYGIGYYSRQNCMKNESWFTTYSQDCLQIQF